MIIIQRTVYISFSFILAFAAFASAQTANIEGTVYSDTGQPIQGANVLITGTATGTSTDSEGAFSFETNMQGEMEITVSYIGYHTEARTILLDDESTTHILEFELETGPVELDDIVVSADNTEWFQKFEAFRREFIGSNQFARETTIQNRWVIDFVQNPDGEFFARASEPIILVNRALGFKKTVNLNEFTWRMNSNTGFYLYDVDFEYLEPENDRELQKWESNRKTAFQGSFTHFLASLFDGHLSRNQFEVVRFESNEPDRIYEADRNRELLQLLRQHNIQFSDFGEDVKAFSIRNPVDILYGQSSLRFHDNRKRARLTPQTNSGIFIVRKDASIVNPMDIGLEGYWANERMANELPAYYRPE